MFSHQVVFILLTVLKMSILTTAGDAFDDSTDRPECGQYGFRCLNEKVLEFCQNAIDGVTEKPDYHECEADFYCDEDNPAFCTPKEPPNKFVQDSSKNKEGGSSSLRGGYSQDEINFGEELYELARAVRESLTDDDTTFAPTTESPDEVDFTTVNITPPPPFECETYGFFPDKKNNTLFWYCDVPLNGVGFLLRHMMCGMGRHYDDFLKNCILEGTIRHGRKDGSGDSDDTVVRKVKHAIECMGKTPGKYADSYNCRIYHLCLAKHFSPAIQLTFMCPRRTAYDDKSQSCTIAAYNRCQVNQRPPNTSKINCRSPTRFRSTEDCSSYFLCFVDNVIEIKCPKFYKFDDTALECLSENVAECKEYPV